MAKQINQGRPQKRKTKKQYKKENVKLHKKGRNTALNELQDDETIYMLGDNPVYVHSRDVYYKAGRQTAIKILEKDLNKTILEVKNLIPSVQNILDSKLKVIYTTLGFNNFDDFTIWWETQVEPYGDKLINDSESLYYLSKLEEFKNNAAAIAAYNYMRRQGDAKKLASSGFVSADFILSKGAVVSKDSIISQIKDNQRNLLQELSNYLTPKIDSIGSKTVKNAIESIQKGAKNKDPNNSYAKEIGNIFEYITSLYSRQIDNSIKVKMENVAGEKTGKSTKDFKADTKHIIELGNTTLSFLSSDKTGMQYMFGSQYDAQKRNTIDKFTAGLATDTLDIFQQATTIDFNTIDPRITNIFNYIVKNADYFNRRDDESKNLIVSFFAWAKLITELIGSIDNIDNMPVVVRIFNRLYKTSDILNKFTNIEGIKILDYVNKTYMENFYRVFNASGKISREELRNAKKEAMSNMEGNVTYRKLKNSIVETLSSLNQAISRKSYFSTSYSIILDNLKNRK